MIYRKNKKYDFDCVVVGAGVIGLSVARSLSKSGFRVTVLESNSNFGQETSSRNSGVIHAGIYYNQSSFKSIFCREGNKALYEYASNRKIKFKKCGKIIFAKNYKETDKLFKLQKNAKKNNVILKHLSLQELKLIEPDLTCHSALLSDSTGIIDVHDLMLNFIVDIEKNNGKVVYNCKVGIEDIINNTIRFTVNNTQSYSTKIFINSAGLNSHKLAKEISKKKNYFVPNIKYVKGNYIKLSGKSPFKRLIYPLPSKDGLGIHSTINLSNQTIFGPDEEVVEKINYNVNENIVSKFIKSISSFWPNIISRKVEIDYCGIRTKVDDNDFIIQTFNDHKIKGLVNLLGIESPGLTSSIPIGNYVTEYCKKYFK